MGYWPNDTNGMHEQLMEEGMFQTIEVRTNRRAEWVDITALVDAVVRDSGVTSGLCVVHVPHTSAGLTLNENADPSVRRDVLAKLDQLVPENDGYVHLEGNSDAHIKASLLGFNVTLLIEDHRLLLGTWQGLYLAEFDGPRTRRVLVKVHGD